MLRRSLVAVSVLTAGLLVWWWVARDVRTEDMPPLPGDIATSDPIVGYKTGFDGAWFIFCQAREDTDGNGVLDVWQPGSMHAAAEGDREAGYLVLGTGPGERIEYPAAFSRDGAWLAVVRGGRLELIDARTFQRHVLDADLTHDAHQRRNERFVSIAENGSRMTYLRRDARNADAIVIRDLTSGAERTVTLPDLVWRADVDDSGRWARVETIHADTDGNGIVTWPGGPVTWSHLSCGHPPLPHYSNPHDGDAVTVSWLDLATGTLVADPRIVMPLGDELIRREPDGALVLGTTRLTDGACNAEIEHTIISPPRVLVRCNGNGPIIITGPGIRKPTRKDYLIGLHDHGRYTYLDDTTYIDVVDGTEIPLPGKGWFQAIGAVTLVEIRGEWAAFDLVRKTITPLPGARGEVGFELRDTAIVPINGSYYDLSRARRIGAVDDRIVMIDRRGRALRRPPDDPDLPHGHFAGGPLRWGPVGEMQ